MLYPCARHVMLYWFLYSVLVQPRKHPDMTENFFLALVCGVCCEFVTFPLVFWVRCGA